ncbi:MAG: hypothetical protein MRJ96_08235 [Nitrospirales bacterium]|nr:hypothetical protein [Nitrospira sp.]MDR4501420.1 hypothetical protein [Nitrospirales bacterium]
MNDYTLSDVTVETWVQGNIDTLESLTGSVVLIEVFQVNCPGCFIYALPTAIQWHQHYQDQGLAIIGLATAFEDYDQNTLTNLQRLIDTGEVFGETRKALTHQGVLTDGKLDWRLPFPVGMDRIVPDIQPVTQERVVDYAKQCLPSFHEYSMDQQQKIFQQVRTYLKQKTMKAETFERFALQGTPSSLLFDRKGHLQHVSFGDQLRHLPSVIEKYLRL